jgi:hypothetical protein
MHDPIEELRANAAALPAAPEAMAAYLAKVRDRAYTVTDADVAGLDEDAVFEQTVGVAIREGLRRLDRAREVLG